MERRRISCKGVGGGGEWGRSRRAEGEKDKEQKKEEDSALNIWRTASPQAWISMEIANLRVVLKVHYWELVCEILGNCHDCSDCAQVHLEEMENEILWLLGP